MNTTSPLTEVLYTITTELLTPVIVALLVLAGYALLQLGGLVAELAARRRRAAVIQRLATLKQSAKPIALQRVGGILEIATMRLVQGKAFDHDELQLLCERALLAPKLCARLGPMLGLAGTLIPLGPGLRAFAEGNTYILSNNLVIAFSTTVIGLVAGGASYACYTLRRHWYTEDLHALEKQLNRRNAPSPLEETFPERSEVLPDVRQS